MHRRTVCNRDCPDACALVATVQGERLVRVEGDRSHPITQGAVCARTRRFPDRQHHANRLRAPLMRTPDGFRETTWDDALKRIAEQLVAIRSSDGPQAILNYRSGGSLGSLKSLTDALFAWFGPVSGTHGSVCNGAGRSAQEADFGISDAHDPTDLDNARNIVLWGKNPLTSSMHVAPWVRRARQRGGRVVLIDPVYHASARLADRVIQPRPGGDFAFACGVASHLLSTGRADNELINYADGVDVYFDLLRGRSVEQWAKEADVSLGAIAYLADLVSDRPCAFLLGWGMARRRAGRAIVRAIDALCAVSGNVGIAGGGASYRCDKRGALAAPAHPEPSRTFPEPQLGRALLRASDPAIRAVWISCGNPVVMLPDSRAIEEGLRTRDLVVVVDSFLTDTARCASFVLPTTTLFEDEDIIASFGHHWLGASRPVLRAPDGVLTDLQIVQRLAARIDELRPDAEPLAPRIEGSAADWKRRFAQPLAAHGIDVERLEHEAVANPFAPVVPFEARVFSTASGRMQLLSTEPEPESEESRRPLWLMSNSIADAQCSQWSVDVPTLLPAVCHPDAAPGRNDGDEALLRNDMGELRVRLSFDDRQRRDIVVVPKGGPFATGHCVNTLVSDALTEDGAGAAYLDARVSIE